MSHNGAAAVVFAAVLGVGPFAGMPQTPELRRELSTLRRQIRTGAADAKIVLTIRRITALRAQQARAPRWLTAQRKSALS